MNIRLLLLGYLLLLVSCKQNTTEYEKLIVGEWKVENKNYRTKLGPLELSPVLHTNGYEFLPNHVVEEKNGFFEEVIEGQHLRYERFLGTRASYKIEKDSLKIYDPKGNVSTAVRILSLTANTLLLEKGHYLLVKLSRLPIQPIVQPKFDRVIISASGCFGSCPMDNISIARNGIVHYNGEMYTPKIGQFQSSISRNDFDKIQKDFNKSNFINLQDRYQALETDGEEVSVTFVKDNRIIKTICDYRRQSPAEFNWAYEPIRYLYQKLSLKKVDHPLYVRNIAIDSGNKVYYLPKSEGFYLNLLLADCKPVTRKFKAYYAIKFNGDSTIERMFTNGRLYRLTFKNGETKTFDVGFNFLTNIGISKKLTAKRRDAE